MFPAAQRAVTFAAVMSLIATSAALAHHPMGGATPQTFWHGLLSGLGHPLIGVDHLAFIVGMGLLAGVQRAGLAIGWAFVAASLVGVLAAVNGMVIAHAEALVAASVVGVGVVMALRAFLPRLVWLAVAVLAGFIHGNVFAESVVGAETTPIAAYLTGLAIVQAGVVTACAVLGERWRDSPALAQRLRPAGIALAIVGAGFFTAALTTA